MLHTDPHLSTALITRKSGRSLETFKQSSALTDTMGTLDKKLMSHSSTDSAIVSSRLRPRQAWDTCAQIRE